MIEKESKILLTLQEEGGYKPRFVYNKEEKKAERIFEQKFPHSFYCTKKITLGPAFIERALSDPTPAYSLKLLKPNDSSKKFYKLSDMMKLHLHIKLFVADYYGLNFGGKVSTFTWALV